MLTAEFFTIARAWKQPRCSSTDEWIKKLESVLMRWMNLEPITQNEISQKEKYKYHTLTHIYGV